MLKSDIYTTFAMKTDDNLPLKILEESYSLQKQNNEILMENNLLLKEMIGIMKGADEKLRKIAINTS